MRCHYLIASESFSMDDATGRVSLFHILDQMQVSSTPFLLQNIVLSGLFEKDENDEANGQTCDAFIKLNGKIMSQTVLNVEFGEDITLNRLFTRINGVSIPDHGLIVFSVENKGELLNSWSVEVIDVNARAREKSKKHPVGKSAKRQSGSTRSGLK